MDKFMDPMKAIEVIDDFDELSVDAKAELSDGKGDDENE